MCRNNEQETTSKGNLVTRYKLEFAVWRERDDVTSLMQEVVRLENNSKQNWIGSAVLKFCLSGKLHPCLGFLFSYNRLERALDQRPSDYLPRKKICLLQTNRQDFCRVLQTACLFTPLNCPAQEATKSVAVTNRSKKFQDLNLSNHMHAPVSAQNKCMYTVCCGLSLFISGFKFCFLLPLLYRATI